jgi:adenine-specific DNA-methyltransferase
MKGFVPTPSTVVDLMVRRLFARRAPTEVSTLLDPGCGDGEFIDGVLRFCAAEQLPVPRIVGIELDAGRAGRARDRFASEPKVEIRKADFLRPTSDRFDFVVGNPPYVSILQLTTVERSAYRDQYRTARGRFDLYLLFFEQGLRLLRPGGRLVYITPEKFAYVETAQPLRDLLSEQHVEELYFTDEATFPDRVTYPLITTVTARTTGTSTRIRRRDGSTDRVALPRGTSWQPAIAGYIAQPSSLHLADVTRRISCGVATGADSVFVVPTHTLTSALSRFAFPTISGRQIDSTGAMALESSLIAPYDERGRLLPEAQLGRLGAYLREPARLRQLRARSCVAQKPWYAFHDNLPLEDVLRPKLLCKDITDRPHFVLDRDGSIVPRHSVYYIVPADASDLEPLAEYLNSATTRAWLRAHCQRAANGFLRLQSHVLKRVPLPPGEFVRRPVLTDAESLELALQSA